jgi:hypothetical protein
MTCSPIALVKRNRAASPCSGRWAWQSNEVGINAARTASPPLRPRRMMAKTESVVRCSATVSSPISNFASGLGSARSMSRNSRR